MIIEGTKLSGKSALVGALRQRHRSSTVIEYRAYFGAEGERTLARDLPTRLSSLAGMCSGLPRDDLILLRAHLFPFALAAVTSQRVLARFEEMDDLFAGAGLALVLLSIDEATFATRLADRRASGRPVRDWDARWANMCGLQEELRACYEASKLPRLTLNSAELTPEMLCDRVVEVTQ